MKKCLEFCEVCTHNCCHSSITDSKRGRERVPIFQSDHREESVLPVMVQKTDEISCKFLYDNRCLEYSDRPIVCSAYPFTASFLHDIMAVTISQRCGYGRYLTQILATPEHPDFNEANSIATEMKVKLSHTLTEEEIISWGSRVDDSYRLIAYYR